MMEAGLHLCGFFSLRMHSVAVTETSTDESGVEPNSTNNDYSGSLPRDWLADSLAGSVLIKHCRSAD